MSASLRVIQDLTSADTAVLLVGRGPASFRRTTRGGFPDLGISYGIVGWSQTAISIGLPGVFFFALAYASAIARAFDAVRRGWDELINKWIGFTGISGGMALMYEYFFYGSSMMGTGAVSVCVMVACGLVQPRQETRHYAAMTLMPEESSGKD